MLHLLEEQDPALRMPSDDLLQGVVLSGVAHRDLAMVSAGGLVVSASPAQPVRMAAIVLAEGRRAVERCAVHVEPVEAHLLADWASRIASS